MNFQCMLRLYTLRHIRDIHDLKELIIKVKLGGNVKDCDDFDVGYVQGPGDRVVTIRTKI